MNNITYILYEFYQEFTEIQGKSDRDIGKMHRKFLTALVAKDCTNFKAEAYLKKSKSLSESKAKAGSKGAESRWQRNGSANGSANSIANGTAIVLPMAIEENRIEKNRIEKNRIEKNRIEENTSLVRAHTREDFEALVESLVVRPKVETNE